MKIVAEDKRYSPESYAFVSEAVAYTVKRLKREKSSNRHVTAAELIEGICDFAAEQFGPLAYNVLYDWGLRNGEAVGNVVYNMINTELLKASEDDTLEAFVKCPMNFEQRFKDRFTKTPKKIKAPIIE